MDLPGSGLRFRHAELPPHDTETRTGPFQIGVSFSAHRDVHYRVGGLARTATYGGGAVVATADEAIVWSRVREPTEALEIYVDRDLVHRVSGGVTTWPVHEPLLGRPDPVVLGVATVLRRAHVTRAELGDVESGALAHRLVEHLLTSYGGLPRRAVTGGPTRKARLTSADLGTVAEVVDAGVADVLSLDALAATVHLSPFHFARAFKASVGITPWAFVTARRMDRARLLLRTTDAPVEAVASEVGFTNLSHFRRLFAAHTGCTPARYRASRR
jgi:AraC family transcriptional regulator